MSKPAPIAAPALQPDPHFAEDPASVGEADLLAASAARVEHRLSLLDELAEMAMTMARAVAAQATAGKGATTDVATRGTTSASAADDFAKLSRAVRLTLDLAGRLEEFLRALRAGEAAARVARRQEGEARASRARMARATVARAKVAEQVAAVIFSESEFERESWDLLDALEERLGDDAAYIDLEDRPLREVVERLCADLGLTPDWSRWTDEGWPQPASEFLRTRPPWSPFNQVSRKPVSA